MQLVMRRIRSLAVLAVASVLAACGGGNGGEAVQSAAAPQARALVYSVESREQPASAVQDVARVKDRAVGAAIAPARIALGPLDQSKEGAVSGFGPRQVGSPRSIAQTATASATSQQLQWTPTASGGQVAALSFSADGAHGLRLGVLVRQLPGSAVLRVYSQARPSAVFEIAGQEVLQIIERNQAAGDTSDAGRTWWTPDTGGDEATLEIELPSGTPASAIDLSVPRLSHIYDNLSLPTAEELEQQTKINESDACNLDSTCYDDYAAQRNAVARMLFVYPDGKTYVCSGTLLNDRDGTGTPYFISANHCISTQTVASTLRTDWFYRSPSCNSRTLSSATTARTGGATLLYATDSSDTSFLRLNEAPPAGAVFAAWNANPQGLGGAVVGIHHPKGDLQKISFGNLASLTACSSISDTNFTCSGTSGNFYRVTWSQGTTEGGSSGSGIFSGGALIGTLYGGSAVCTNKASSDYYGRFDVAYNASIKNWLSPATSASGRTAVYRFFNSSTGAHFFTASAGERDFVINTYPAFAYEGVAFYAYGGATAGQSAVYRFFNKSNGAHFYTIDAGERDFVRATYPSFEYEGPIWYAQTGAGNGSTAMYRFFNKSNGTHFYTISQGERDFVQATYPVYQYEGPVYYAWTSN
ncbi:trypsin-like peptidase domain-containing protein [Acidovorax sp. SUPP2522]|uniref:trypsin-like peptidase domain-containing protein n=1 Tax=unclassified Acidovorax TaxID=2684926 RepID=UPI00234B7858|nr:MULTISPECIES: trypsin-like peptidase domain-containing protein [unclassified Acidovorax]WCM98509.1 serine protease [Acidovorax sp. GBBC 1281]GKT13967.1 trypsin-like peptidase domain-containing protein [Acidovorax sp. SUPP2522]